MTTPMPTPIRSEPVATSLPGRPTLLIVSDTTHRRIAHERDAGTDAGENPWSVLQTFRQYALGNHPQTLTADQQRTLRMLATSTAGRLFADNLCKVVLRAATDRLAVDRFAVDPSGESDAANVAAGDVDAYLGGVMTRNGGGSLQTRVHFAAVRDGNTAVSLRWDNARQAVRIRPEPWWDGRSGVWVAYDADGEPEYAVRDWVADEVIQVDGQTRYRDVARRIVWWPDRIERYRKDGDGWQPAPLAGEPETGIVPWVRPNSRPAVPLHLPVIHFAANADDDHPYGVSDLAGGVLALQDELNDIQRSVTAAARHAGFPMYFASGIKTERLADGSPAPTIEVEPGKWVTVDKAEARAVVLEAGQIGPLLDAYRLKLQAVCRMTGTPEHEITGVWPSGEALLRAEIALVQRVERLQDLFAGAWTTVAHRATELANAFGRRGLDEDALIACQWASADRRDPISLATIQKARVEALQLTETLRSDWALREAGVPEDAAKDIAELNGMLEMDAGIPTRGSS